MKLKQFAIVMLFAISFALLSLFCMSVKSSHAHHAAQTENSACVTLHGTFLKSAASGELKTLFSVPFLAFSLVLFTLTSCLQTFVNFSASFLLLFLIIFYLSKIKFKKWLAFFEKRDNWALELSF